MVAAVGAAVLALAGCAPASRVDLSWVGAAFSPVDLRRPPPEIVVRRGGPSGELLNGPAPPLVPDDDVDAAIGAALLPALSPAERRALAEASQLAAAAITDTPVPWNAAGGDHQQAATGVVVPVDDAYRSVRGLICRDVRQGVNRDGAPRLTQVTLCRKDRGNGLFVWLVGQADP